MLEIPPTPGRRGVIGVVVRDGRFLMIRRSAHVVAPLAHCFPGGGIHPGESEPEALVREFQEELHLKVRPLRRIWESVTPWQVCLSWWSAELPADAQPVANPAEVESIHWVTPTEMAALPNPLPSNFEFLEALRAGQINLSPQ
ncbi:MAG TPA: NUDIX domain-containing protein [Thermoguttaceae bacterium]|nr:NUDIX domain-containing protein [Thermoguttaceae bacterium]